MMTFDAPGYLAAAVKLGSEESVRRLGFRSRPQVLAVEARIRAEMGRDWHARRCTTSGGYCERARVILAAYIAAKTA